MQKTIIRKLKNVNAYLLIFIQTFVFKEWSILAKPSRSEAFQQQRYSKRCDKLLHLTAFHIQLNIQRFEVSAYYFTIIPIVILEK